MSFHFVYSSSNEYAPFMKVSIASLLTNNPDLSDVTFWILTHDMSTETKSSVSALCESHNAKVFFIDAQKCIKQIFSNGGTLNFNPSSFLRIFIPELLPEEVEKALFVDSDTYIQCGIKELYETDLSNYFCAMSCNAPIYIEMLQEASLDPSSPYYNAGVILLNLKKWRESNTQQMVLQYYYQSGGNFPTDDQSVINAILAANSNTKRLPYKYNAMIVNFYCSYTKFCKINTTVGICSREEYVEAQKKPVIIHFNGPGVRPWEKYCGHPYTSIYRTYLFRYNPQFKLLTPANKSVLHLILQYIKHRVIDKIECQIKN